MGRGGEVDVRNQGGGEAAEGAGGGRGGETDAGKGETGGGETGRTAARSDVAGVREYGRVEVSGTGGITARGWPKSGTSSKTRMDREGGTPWARDCYSREKLHAVHRAGVTVSVGSRGAHTELPAVLTAEKAMQEVRGTE